MHRILLVDDQAEMLGKLESLFHTHAEEFEVESYSSAQEALARAVDSPFAVVIVDFDMPEMDGVAFTKTLWESHPDVACIILSSLSDRETLINRVQNVLRSRQQQGRVAQPVAGTASNRRNILRFINKPWDETGLIVLVAQVLAFRSALMENHRLIAEYGPPQTNSMPPQHYQVLVVDEGNLTDAVARGLNFQSPFHDLHAAMRHRSALESRRDIKEYRFIVESSNSPRRALELTERISFDVIISDHQMSEMDGMHFLGKLRESQPYTPRLLLSEQVDTKLLIDAINNVGIFGYIDKQWGLHDTKNAVTQAIAYRQLLLENRQFEEWVGQ